MRLLFSEYRISTALDAASPLAPALQQKLAANDDLRRFAQGLSALDHALRTSVPQPEPPPALHVSIMCAFGWMRGPFHRRASRQSCAGCPPGVRGLGVCFVRLALQLCAIALAERL